MQTYSAVRLDAPILLFAPGAGAGEHHPWMRRVAEGLAERGVTVATFDFPYRLAGRRVPDRGPILEQAYRDAWSTMAEDRGRDRPLFLGGKSMGGRIATQIAAGGDLRPSPAGVVCFGYPLHPPGRPAQRRDRHLPTLSCPVLFLHGTRDPFGTAEEMRELAAWVPHATLSIVEGGDHSLLVPARAEPAVAFAHVLDAAASWILERI